MQWTTSAGRRTVLGMTSNETSTFDPATAGAPDDHAAPKAVNHAFFMLVRTTPVWLQLTPVERFGWLDEVVRPILAANRRVTMRFFDSEAFNSRCSDVLLWETADVMAYQAVVEALRETSFWGTYFDVVDIVASVENAYAIRYGVDAY